MELDRAAGVLLASLGVKKVSKASPLLAVSSYSRRHTEPFFSSVVKLTKCWENPQAFCYQQQPTEPEELHKLLMFCRVFL